MPIVRAALFPLLTLPRTTTFNLSSSHIQLALSRNFIVLTPSVHFAILVASLYSVLPVDLSVALSVKEESSPRVKSIVTCLLSRQHREAETFAAERTPRYSEEPVPDRRSTLGKGRKRFLPRIQPLRIRSPLSTYGTRGHLERC